MKADYTPFGYIQNPFHQSVTTYRDVTDGVLRSDDEAYTFGWYYPWVKNHLYHATAGIAVGNGRRACLLRTRDASCTVRASRHSARIFAYAGGDAEIDWETEYWLVRRRILGIRLTVTNRGYEERTVSVSPFLHAFRRDGPLTLRHRADGAVHVQTPAVEGRELPTVTFTVAGLSPETMWAFRGDAEAFDRRMHDSPPFPVEPEILPVAPTEREGGTAASGWAGASLPVTVAAGASVIVYATLAATPEPVTRNDLDESRRAALASDARFHAPALAGDWPEHWPQGFEYDFQTTRMCTMPPTGIFEDVWPTWMLTYPRVVLAEGTMDMFRLGYADPDLAGRGMLSIFRDTPTANAPCVFSSGEFNMVAEDGARCGTSPAWCVPFHSIYQYFLHHPSVTWVREIFPHLAAYLEWWDEHRTDPEGWVVYKCTYEAGEDNNPRLDPRETGAGVISDYVRPVELQAAMAHGATVLRRFAQYLGRPEDEQEWGEFEARYAEKTRRLFDESTGRFRDWDRQRNDWVPVVGKNDYWGSDFTRFSPLSLVPLLFETASEAQQEAMRRELPDYYGAPQTVWPSWCAVTMEAATALGLHNLAGTMAWEVIARVYPENDRRSIEETNLPLPGSAREYWPLDLREFKGNDAYAWGAQTATMLVRQVAGFRASPDPSRLEFLLCPALPEELPADAALELRGIAYRGRRISLAYTAGAAGKLLCDVSIDRPAPCLVRQGTETVYRAKHRTSHRLELRRLESYTVTLEDEAR